MLSPSSTATPSEQSLYAALELSKNSWLLAIRFSGWDNPSLHPIESSDANGLMAKLDVRGNAWLRSQVRYPR